MRNSNIILTVYYYVLPLLWCSNLKYQPWLWLNWAPCPSISTVCEMWVKNKMIIVSVNELSWGTEKNDSCAACVWGIVDFWSKSLPLLQSFLSVPMLLQKGELIWVFSLFLSVYISFVCLSGLYLLIFISSLRFPFTTLTRCIHTFASFSKIVIFPPILTLFLSFSLISIAPSDISDPRPVYSYTV